MRLFKKALKDLFGNRSRLITAFLAMLLGTTVFGAVTFSYRIIENEVKTAFTQTSPASGTIVVDRLDDNLLELTQNFSGIAHYDIKAFYELRMEKPDGKTKTLLLFSSPDFSKNSINKLKTINGSFSTDPDEVLLEQDALSVAGEEMGGTLPIRMPDDSLQNYTIVGSINDLSQHPPSMHNQVYAYVSEETLSAMGLSMNKLDFFVSGDPYDRENILDITSDYISLLEKSGYKILMVDVSNTPGISMHLAEYQGALFIFQVFSVLAFLFGAIIMSSLLSTILAGQVRQIGILKSIGAKTGGVFLSYMGAAMVLIILNLALALPLSILLSRMMSSFLLGLGNMYISAYNIPALFYIIFIAVSTIIPLVLAVLPIYRGLSISVKDALNDTGISSTATEKEFTFPSWISDKVSRPVLLSLRSATRNKRRFFANLVMLTLGGILFVGIMTSLVSINTALSSNMNAMRYDYQIGTGSYGDSEKIPDILEELHTVTGYEIWGATAGKLVYDNGNTGNSFSIMAPSHDTAMLRPELIEGRWLEKADTNSIVVSFEFLNLEQDYKLGDTLTFRFGDIMREFVIVGVVKEIGVKSIYMNQSGFEELIPENMQKTQVKISTTLDRNKRQIYHVIEDQFTLHGVTVVTGESKAEQYSILKAHFTTTLTSFLIIAIMTICVAGFGLASTMSLQVAERTREIGIMKSMGAGTKKIRSIVTAESRVISLFGWCISAVLSIPTAVIAVYIIGALVLKIPLSVPASAILLSLFVWLLLTLAVGFFASQSAAKKAAKMTVKSALLIE